MQKCGGCKIQFSSVCNKYYSALGRHLGSQLAELERVIERMMEADFVEFATANLGRTTEDDMGNEDLVDEVFSKKKKKPSDLMALYHII